MRGILILCAPIIQKEFQEGLSTVLDLREDMQFVMATLDGKTITKDVGASVGMVSCCKLVDPRTLSDHIQNESNLVGEQLEADRTISACTIQKEYVYSFLPMLHSLRGGTQLFTQTPAKTLNAKTITLDIQASDVIRALIVSPLRGGMQIYLKTLTAQTTLLIHCTVEEYGDKIFDRLDKDAYTYFFEGISLVVGLSYLDCWRCSSACVETCNPCEDFARQTITLDAEASYVILT